MIHVLVVEDHAFLRESLVLQLENLDTPMEILSAGNATEAITWVRETSAIDLVLLDLALPDMDGFACLTELKKIRPNLHIAILSAYDDSATICRAKAGGASGFLSKRMSANELLQAIQLITSGDAFWAEPYGIEAHGSLAAAQITSRITGKGLKAKNYGLTDRQQELLGFLGNGLSNREIGDKMGIGQGTVKSHLNTIYKQLGVSSRAQALALIQRFGIKP